VKQDVPIERKALITNGHSGTNKLSSAVEPCGSTKPVPLPRNCGTIKVSFTARVFPTPMRESQGPEEEEVISFYAYYSKGLY
jgi:hypothetical protein